MVQSYFIMLHLMCQLVLIILKKKMSCLDIIIIACLFMSWNQGWANLISVSARYWHFLPDRGIGQTRLIQIQYCAYTILCYCYAPRKPQKHHKAPKGCALYSKCSEAVLKFNVRYRLIFKLSSHKLFSLLQLSVILHSAFKLRVVFGYDSQDDETLFKMV